ncbi:MAG: MFS transporter [Pseudomonadota bacterium]
MRTLFLFGPLLVSVMLIQLGVGVLGPLDVLSGEAYAFSAQEIGLLGSAHFVGFFIGCVAAPMLMARAGHSRAFSVVAAAGVLSALGHPILPDPVAWMLLRVLAGFAVAGGYTVIESWLQAKLKNSNRGRILSMYRVVDMAGSVGSQLLIVTLEPASYVSYNIVAAVAVLSLLPLALTVSKAPPSPRSPRLRPLKAIRLSPLGAFGVVVVGLTSSSFRMVGPLYGSALNLTIETLALFLAAAMFGGVVAQPGVGWLADKFDRRRVLVWISVAALLVCAGLSTGVATASPTTLIIGSFLFGAAAMPLYSISAAHANDHCPADEVVELNASLIFLFAVGAIVSPTVAAMLIDAYGPNALWLYIAAAHVALIVFSLYRMTRRPTPTERTRYRYLPRTSMTLSRLFKSPEDPSHGEPRPAESETSSVGAGPSPR